MIFRKKPANPRESQLIDEIWAHLPSRFKMTHSKAARVAAQHIADDESIVIATEGVADDTGAMAVMVVTNRRIIIGTALPGKTGFIELPFELVDRVDVEQSEMSGGAITLYNDGQVTRLDRSGATNLEQVRDAIRQRQTETPSRDTAQTEGTAGELAKLAELHASGVLTNDEFAAAKARVLGL